MGTGAREKRERSGKRIKKERQNDGREIKAA